MGNSKIRTIKTALIISDGKPGHFNQSIAYCKYIGANYQVLSVAYKSKFHKVCSYLFDLVGLRLKSLYTPESFAQEIKTAELIVATGSTTYYAAKILAKEFKCPSIAILHPKGYKLNFSQIYCPFYDQPPQRSNITRLPLNLCVADPAFFQEKTEDFKKKHSQQQPAIGLIIGGPNGISEINPKQFKKQLEQIFALTPDHEHWITTSRRTPTEIEEIIDGFQFDYALINSREDYNPIPAFLQLCERLVVTSDSASMISECASFGTAKVEVLMNQQLKSPNKFEELIHQLEEKEAVHIFDGTLGRADKKVDLSIYFKKDLATK